MEIQSHQRDFGAHAMVFRYSEYALKSVLEWLFENGTISKENIIHQFFWWMLIMIIKV